MDPNNRNISKMSDNLKHKILLLYVTKIFWNYRKQYKFCDLSLLFLNSQENIDLEMTSNYKIT